jgi:hypothetical protein
MSAAARSAEVLALNIEDLDLPNRSARPGPRRPSTSRRSAYAVELIMSG